MGDSQFDKKLNAIRSTTVGDAKIDNKPIEPKEVGLDDTDEVIDARTPAKTDDGLGKGWRSIRTEG